MIPGFFFAQLLWDFWYNGIALTRKQVINFRMRTSKESIFTGLNNLEALERIERKKYEEELLEEGVGRILKDGIAFYKKRCRVMSAADGTV